MLKSVKTADKVRKFSYINFMELSGKKVGVIIALIVSSLAGLVFLQTHFLNNAMEQKREAFRASVMTALGSVVRALETGETARSLLRRYTINADIDGIPGQSPDSSGTIDDSLICQDMVYIIALEDSVEKAVEDVKVVDGKLYYDLPEKQRVTLQIMDSRTGTSRVLVDTIKGAGSYCIPLLEGAEPGNAYSYQFSTDSTTLMMRIYSGGQNTIIMNRDDIAAKDSLLRRAFDNLVSAEWQPIEERIDPENLDSLIRKSMQENGIDLDYAFGVLTGTDSLRIARPPELAERIKNSSFSARLFPHDLFAPPSELRVHFPGVSSYLLLKSGPLLIFTALFMMIIVGCFYYTVRTIIYQRIFSNRMVDFINNMTHEFKTPISSISLATEAIDNPEVIKNREKVVRYNRMIREENARMKTQVEKILQIALIEKGEIELDLTDIELHDLLQKTVDSIMLRVENRGGIINSVFSASNHLIKGDGLHLTNIILNVLDNAIKYSPDQLRIDITTRNEAGKIVVGIRDRGVGISEKSQKLVFDKYYRVPSGNIHEVKGFGLGLSYVKLMMQAHNGDIKLETKTGEGSLVELSFPLPQTSNSEAL